MGKFTEFYLVPENMRKAQQLAAEDRQRKEFARQQEEQEALRKLQKINIEKSHENHLVQQIQEKHKIRDEIKELINQSAHDEIVQQQQMDEYASWQRQEERRKRDLYRQMLDTQIAYSNQMKAYGNMTHIEKQLNKPDLKVALNFSSCRHTSTTTVTSMRCCFPVWSTLSRRTARLGRGPLVTSSLTGRETTSNPRVTSLQG